MHTENNRKIIHARKKDEQTQITIYLAHRTDRDKFTSK